MQQIPRALFAATDAISFVQAALSRFRGRLLRAAWAAEEGEPVREIVSRIMNRAETK